MTCRAVSYTHLDVYKRQMYNTLELLAPEIRGLWSMHGIPGVPDGNGGVDNQNIAQTNYTVIMANCADKDAASSAVDKWYSSLFRVSSWSIA